MQLAIRQSIDCFDRCTKPPVVWRAAYENGATSREVLLPMVHAIQRRQQVRGTGGFRQETRRSRPHSALRVGEIRVIGDGKNLHVRISRHEIFYQ